MNTPITYTHLMFLTLLTLLGLSACSRSTNEDPIVFETRYTSATENMTLDEWEMLKEKMINQINQRYHGHKTGKITVKPLAEASVSVDDPAPCDAQTPPQKNEMIISIPSTLKPNTFVHKAEPQKTEPQKSAPKTVDRYSELKIKPEVPQGKQYKIPPNVANQPEPEAASQPKAQENNYVWPTKGNVTLKFGTLNNGKKSNGIKMTTPANASVYAIDKGKVIFVGSIKGMGKVILIEHPNQIIAAYAQIANINVQPNASITKGQEIATVLTTSKTEGEFHFEIRKGVKSIDPLSILP